MMMKPILQAAKGQKTKEIPVWLMRQAGRYLPEYRAYRQKHNTLTLFQTPAIATEITLQPLRRFALDAAIIYADILLIPDALGLGLSFVQGEGPRFARPVRTEDDVKALARIAESPEKICEKLSYVAETVDRVRSQLAPDKTLIGFAGAPFTVACYMIEGKSSKNDFLECKKFMFSHSFAFHQLMQILTETTIHYLKMQISAGAEIVQLFESWSGALHPADFREFCFPYTKKIISEIQRYVPVINYFGQGAGLLQEALALNANVYGVDWRQDLAQVATQFAGAGSCLQGNLDPSILYAPHDILKQKIEDCLKVGAQYPNGYIFNLGHGCTQFTPLENVEFLVNTVKNYSC